MTQAPLLPTAQTPKPGVTVAGGSFTWEAAKGDCLKGIDLHAAAGQLVMVVGEVGSGKSSLLAALLHELRPRGGSVSIAGALPLH